MPLSTGQIKKIEAYDIKQTESYASANPHLDIGDNIQRNRVRLLKDLAFTDATPESVKDSSHAPENYNPLLINQCNVIDNCIQDKIISISPILQLKNDTPDTLKSETNTSEKPILNSPRIKLQLHERNSAENLYSGMHRSKSNNTSDERHLHTVPKSASVCSESPAENELSFRTKQMKNNYFETSEFARQLKSPNEKSHNQRFHPYLSCDNNLKQMDNPLDLSIKKAKSSMEFNGVKNREDINLTALIHTQGPFSNGFPSYLITLQSLNNNNIYSNFQRNMIPNIFNVPQSLQQHATNNLMGGNETNAMECKKKSNSMPQSNICTFCKKGRLFSDDLARHTYPHTGTRSNKCSICDRSFSFYYNLQRHIRNVHNKEKPFKCSLCKRCFGQKIHLDKHLKSHESKGLISTK
ncbi:hypothetical protein CDAR_109841 [Caerostris darwini]|uniref:C2H2-type domain-containing protein n=1 Tax=Caerostris darwini TaxID=1538125 RepID=A0AAV4ST88_9ARAC|nr:hypothetical protein CDAR_109841 [Caerostris darwini]